MREIPMKKLSVTIFGLVLLPACDQPPDRITGPDGVQDAVVAEAAVATPAGPKTLVLRLAGTDTETVQPVPDPHGLIPGADLASCYTVALFDVARSKQVGEATDCISVLGVANGGVQVVGTTIFDFGQGHTFTTQGLTSVQPTTHGSPDVTHITGAIPTSGSNGVIAGTGRYSNFAAEARLSGAVDLTNFTASATFDCIFVITPL